MLEKTINQYGQKQIINNFNKIVKIGDKFLQVRLIKTQKWMQSDFTRDMPRARFVNPREDIKINYIVDRDCLIKLKQKLKKIE